jgi:hypothetical protein
MEQTFLNLPEDFVGRGRRAEVSSDLGPITETPT